MDKAEQRPRSVFRCAKYLLLLTGVCLLSVSTLVVYNYFTRFRQEREFFEEHRDEFDQLVQIAESWPVADWGCTIISYPGELARKVEPSKISACYNEKHELTWIYFKDPFDSYAIAYYGGDENPTGLNVGNRPYSALCSYELEDHWYLCSFGN